MSFNIGIRDISNIPHAWHPIQEADHLAFRSSLQKWQAAAPYGEAEGRATAVERIMRVKRLGQSVLSLAELVLSDLPALLGELQSLRTLNLSKNRLVILPEAIRNLRHLTQLDLSNNYLESLPATIGNLVDLNQLNLSCNALTALPEEIGHLSRLHSLYLSENQLEELPEAIRSLVGLKTLDLSHNYLVDLPDAMGLLRNLKSCNLSHNQLATLPEGIGNLRRLVHLNFEHNSLEELPQWVNQLRRRRCEIIHDDMPDAAGLPRADLPLMQELLRGLEGADQERFHAFFNAFRGTKDYREPTTREAALSRMNRVIEGLLTAPSFFNEVRSLLEQREAACGDESVTTFSLVEKVYTIHCELPDAKLETVADFLLASDREWRVEVKTLAKVGSYETIESVLKAKLLLKDRLKLPIKIEGMLYRGFASRLITDRTIQAIGDEVVKETSDIEQRVEILSQNALWVHRIEQAYASEVEELEEILTPGWEIYADEEMDDAQKIEQLAQVGINAQNPSLENLRQVMEAAPKTFIEIKTQLVLENLLRQDRWENNEEKKD